jgi:sarcosine oxidase subunit beta
MRYSALRLLIGGLSGQRNWEPAWRSPDRKRSYRCVIVGGGGHGLATAYYLAKVHGIHEVAVLERGWIGGGNTGRNTTVVRSNYFYPDSSRLYDFSLRQYEQLGRELNFNIMFSQRGLVTTCHSRHDLELVQRRVGALRSEGLEASMLSTAEVKSRLPVLDVSPDARFPVLGAFEQKRAGSVRHDAVVWGYARAASALGVDIVQNCEVTGFTRGAGGKVTGVSTNLGDICSDVVAVAAAGHSSVLAAKAGVRLPITSYALQAYVSEPIKPVVNTMFLSLATGLYVSQSDKGGLVIGGPLDLYPSYAQRGNMPVTIDVMSAMADQMPVLGRVRILRQWAGIVDVTPDSSPIIGATEVPGLMLNCGWGTGGFKAIPGGGFTLAHHIATGSPHPLAEPFGLDRFRSGRLIDESAASGIAH